MKQQLKKSDKLFIFIRLLTAASFYFTVKMCMSLTTFIFFYIENKDPAELALIDTLLFVIFKLSVLSLILLKISLSKKAVISNVKKFKHML